MCFAIIETWHCFAIFSIKTLGFYVLMHLFRELHVNCSHQKHLLDQTAPNIVWRLGSAFGGSGRQKKGNKGREGRGWKRKLHTYTSFKNWHLWFLAVKTVQSYSPESVSMPSSRPLTAVRKLPMNRWNVCLL